MKTRRLLLAAVAALLPGLGQAAEVTMGVRTDISSVDPHYHVYVPNRTLARHIFDSLWHTEPNGNIVGGLATSWKVIGEDVWEIKLRENVRFHDGSVFTADDVVFTLGRAPHVPNSPSSYALYTKLIAKVEAVDALTVRITTKGAAPTLPVDLSGVAVISRKAAEGKATSDFNSGKAAIGTGPYRFVEWLPGNRVTLARNPDYWGEKEPWDRVNIRPIANDGARVAAILAGDVDLVESVPGVDRARIASTPTLAVHETDSFRIIYLHMDSSRDVSPQITDANGAPLARNPLKDVRVRRALSAAINRAALGERLLNNMARPAGQYVPPFVPGASPKLKPQAYDPELAKRLLKEAGWENGFNVVLPTSNDRFPNDAQVGQAVGQMLSRIGVRTEVQTMPAAILFSRGSKLEFSLFLAGWVGSGEASSPLTSILATFDPKAGLGQSNRGRWSNPAFDKALASALTSMDTDRRNGFYAEAAEIAVDDMGVVPIYHTVNLWASKRGLTYAARGDEATMAMGLRPAR